MSKTRTLRCKYAVMPLAHSRDRCGLRRPIPISGRASRSPRLSSMSRRCQPPARDRGRRRCASPPCIERACLGARSAMPLLTSGSGASRNLCTELRPERPRPRPRDRHRQRAISITEWPRLRWQAGNHCRLRGTRRRWAGKASVGGAARQGGLHFRWRRRLSGLEDRTPHRPQITLTRLAAPPPGARRPSAAAELLAGVAR